MKSEYHKDLYNWEKEIRLDEDTRGLFSSSLALVFIQLVHSKGFNLLTTVSLASLQRFRVFRISGRLSCARVEKLHTRKQQVLAK